MKKVLERCPFCGKQPEIFTAYDIFQIACFGCKIGTFMEKEEKLAIDSWNCIISRTPKIMRIHKGDIISMRDNAMLGGVVVKKKVVSKETRFPNQRIELHVSKVYSNGAIDPTFDTIKDLDDEDLTFVEILQEN